MKWEVIDVDTTEVEAKYHVSSLVAKLLSASNPSDAQCEELLHPVLHMTTSKAPCVLACCKRILKAKENKEKVFVGGDYDADGICSTAIMKATLDRLGIQNGYYIPDRFKEGYGLKPETVEAAFKKGYSLVLTVDNGVKAHEAIAKAKELGMDIIVTDHHEIDEEIKADLVVHPNYMEDCFEYFSGAGVALEISRNLIGEDDNLTAMAAVAAIGDVMPLWKETRVLVQNGFSILKQGKPRSLSSLFYSNYTDVDENSIGFQIVPKLNAAGRMNDLSNVNTLVPFLLCQNEKDIARFTAQLNHVNDARKALSTKEAAQAEKMVTKEPIDILYDPTFHEGICGLVAGRLANLYHKPVLVMTKANNLIKGSGRSVEGFNMFDFFHDFEYLVAFGGHSQAVGISLKEEDFGRFQEYTIQTMKESGFVFEEPVEKAIALQPEDLSFETVSALSLLSPYPKELIKQNFVIENFEVLEFSETAKVAKYKILFGDKQIDAVAYKRKNLNLIQKPTRFIGRVSINRFRNRVTLQLECEDIA